jgi:ABC-type branched-subunit amino acid transport system ATPase component
MEMLTRIKIRNFKQFEDVDIELGKAVVLIGPNNSGKTTALQALALWDVGMRAWNAKRAGGSSLPKKRPGVTINRRDLISTPVPYASLLWYGLHTRRAKANSANPGTQNIRIDISVSGVIGSKAWDCGFEFDFTNDESFVCRPLRLPKFENLPVTEVTFSEIPIEASKHKFAFLPPMSGLADREFVKEPGEIGVLIGQGQTAQVLRNLCFQIHQREKSHWNSLVKHIRALFDVELLLPQYIAERSEITLAYKDKRGNKFDLSSSGRGLQQTLLLLAHLYANPGSVLLLDEPDAHLEILRQRQTYNLLIQIAEQQGSQIIAASHSEVVLNEAADRDMVIAFVGKPHRIDKHNSQVLKSLRDIGFDQYYQAEEKGWVLYLEGPTDLAILQAFAKSLDHTAQECLERPFVKYVETNLPQKAREHFFGLQEAMKGLVGIAIFDRLDKELQSVNGLTETMWQKKEIENYFCTEEVLLAYTKPKDNLRNDLFEISESLQREPAMRDAIVEVTKFLELDGLSPWSPDVKASDQVLDRVFKLFFKKLELPLQLRKSEYHILAGLMPRDAMDGEITAKLDAIVSVATKAKPKME